jgi:hypothetical protein
MEPTSQRPPPAIKGLAFREFLRWYSQTRGRDAALCAYFALDADLRKHLDPDRDVFGIMPGSWYPIGVATGLLDAVTDGLTLDERTALLRGGVQHTLDVTLSGVYRVLFENVMTPERHAKYTQKIWDNFYNGGTVTGRVLAPGRAEQTVSDWPGHHLLLCEMSIWSLAFMHAKMGLRNVRVRRSACIGGGPSRRASVQRLAAARPSSTSMKAVDPKNADRAISGCSFVITWDA